MKRIIVLLTAMVYTIISIFAQPGTKYDISGKWYAYDANGERNWRLDFTIFYNEDTETYYAQYKDRYVEMTTDGTIHIDEQHSSAIMNATTKKLSFTTDSSFTFNKEWQYIIGDAENRRRTYQLYLSFFTCSCSLRYISNKNKLVGRVEYNRNFEAMGNSHYETVMDAVKNGRGTVFIDCDGDCGGMDVVYRRY